MDSGIIARCGGEDEASREDIVAALLCPFSRRRSPLEPQLRGALTQWATDCFGAATARQLTDWQLVDLVGGWYPDADDEHLMLGASYFAWRFVLDDAIDETALGTSAEALAPLLERLDAAIECPDGSPQDRFSRALADVLLRARRALAPQAYERLRQACSGMLGALLWEAGNRAIGCAPDESAFTMLRPRAAGVTIALELTRSLQSVRPLPGSADDTEMEVLGTLAERIVCWLNDLLSYDKEATSGDVHNLVLVLQRRRGLSTGEALGRAIEMANRDIENFVAAEQRLAPALDVERANWVSGLKSAIRTTLDWTYASKRYRPSSASVRRIA